MSGIMAKIMSSTENLVLACFTLYASPIIISSIPTPSELSENVSNRIKHRWQYEAAEAHYMVDLKTKGPDVARKAPILDSLIYSKPAPAPAAAVTADAGSGSEFFTSFEEFETWLEQPDSVVNAGVDRFFAAPEKLDKFLETLD